MQHVIIPLILPKMPPSRGGWRGDNSYCFFLLRFVKPYLFIVTIQLYFILSLIIKPLKKWLTLRCSFYSIIVY